MRIRRRVAAAALCLLAAAGCGRAPRPQPALHLLDRLDRAAVRWPNVALPGALPKVRPEAPDLGRPAPGAPEAHTRIRLGPEEDRDERLALLAPPGSRFAFRLELPPAPVLRTALARVAEGAPGAAAPTLRILVTPATGATVTLVETAALEADRHAWRPLRADLGRWAGQEVELAFEAAGEAGAAWGAWAAPRVEPAGARGTRPNVVLISIDTLRADRLGSYGYRTRPTTPRLDELAARALRFDQAIAQAPWTRPSHRSLLTGLYPMSRGDLGRRWLAEVLWHAGYRTLAMTGGGQVDSRLGFDRGFASYQMCDWLRAPERVVERVDGGGEAPFFLFLHTYEPHEPYTDFRFVAGAPAGRFAAGFSKAAWQRDKAGMTAEEKELASALYDGDIAFTDQQLGAFFAAVERAGWLEDTVFVLTSDHGEQFWEHGTWGHGQTVYDHQLRVPLLVHLPAALRAARGLDVAPGSAIADQVQLVDVYPTLLDLVGVPAPVALQGRSLVPLLDGSGLPAGEAFAEGTNIREAERRALRTLRFKFIHSFPRRPEKGGLESFELYDLKSDPGEQLDVSRRHPEVVAGLAEKVRRLASGEILLLEEELPEGIDPELRDRLQALGYLGN